MDQQEIDRIMESAEREIRKAQGLADLMRKSAKEMNRAAHALQQLVAKGQKAMTELVFKEKEN